MSNKNSRQSSPSTPPPHHAPSKLPKFLQKQSTRDRSKGLMDPSGSTSTSSIASGSSAPTSPEPTTAPTKTPRKGSKFLGIREKDKEEKAKRLPDTPPDTNNANNNNGNNTTAEMDDPPVIVEPVNIPRARTRSERPAISTSELQAHATLYSSTSSASRMGDLPTRLSGWFANTFSTSTTDLSLPSLLSQSSASPKSKASALLTAAKHGKGHLDKAMRYLLDSDALPDKCSDPIWLLGVQHPGYEPPPSSTPSGTPDVVRAGSPTMNLSPAGRRNSGSPPSFRSSTSSVASSMDMSPSQSSSSTKHPHNPAANWPPVFYIDFTSRIWLTYRSHFPTPIKDTRLADLCGDVTPEIANSPTTVKTRPWNWGGEKTWSSDTGWGCMLRTGQSLLANALVHLHLGRDWRRPPYPVQTADYATYVQIVTWFLDTPAPEAPFSVHRMALAGKEFGTDVGQWFGPSVAAGAIKTLVNSFPESGLGVSVATDGTLFQSDVFAVSHGEMSSRSPRRIKTTTWGHRPVLLLLGIRLGIEGVNPIYYETIKLLYTFPQSVGIAGGRPGSSYYFVGSQADNLFYLDPHNTRPAIPLRPAPSPGQRESTPESDRDSFNYRRTRSPTHQRAPTSPSSVRTGSSTFSYHAPVSPSPLQQQFSTSSTDSSISKSPSSFHGRWRSASASQAGSPMVSSSDMDHRELNGISFGSGRDSGLDPAQEHYCSAYSATELRTFHCERVRKMPLGGLDPSMLIGFLCRDEAEWWDFKKRAAELPKTIFSIQDEPPTWPSGSDDDDMGLESISEPDDLDMDMEGEDAEGEPFFESCSRSASNSSAGASNPGGSERGKSEDIDTEEDPVDPVTPGPNSRFDIIEIDPRKGGESYDDDDLQFHPEDEGETFDDDIEDDWVEPSLPTPTPAGPLSPPTEPEKDDPPSPPPAPPALTKSKSNGSTKKSKKGKKQIPVPVPIVRLPSQQSKEHYPFPVTPAEEPSTSPQPRERSRNPSNKGGKRMHTARARDGGRTQSGGVKGILTDD